MESLNIHKRRKVVGEVSVGACSPLTWLCLKISVSLWLADLFSGVGDPTTY